MKYSIVPGSDSAHFAVVYWRNKPCTILPNWTATIHWSDDADERADPVLPYDPFSTYPWTLLHSPPIRTFRARAGSSSASHPRKRRCSRSGTHRIRISCLASNPLCISNSHGIKKKYNNFVTLHNWQQFLRRNFQFFSRLTFQKNRL